jgi:3-mercaptopyruvate sulfurtransferase SseA
MDLGSSTSSEVALGADVDKREMRNISASHSALILDARPQSIFTLGHIPSALNLPRNDFKKSYQGLQKMLSSYWNKAIVVYCSERNCPDSRLVGEALRRLGYQDVRLFRGGWDEWVDNEQADDGQADGEQVNGAQVDGEPVYASLPTPEGCGCGH